MGWEALCLWGVWGRLAGLLGAGPEMVMTRSLVRASVTRVLICCSSGRLSLCSGSRAGQRCLSGWTPWVRGCPPLPAPRVYGDGALPSGRSLKLTPAGPGTWLGDLWVGLHCCVGGWWPQVGLPSQGLCPGSGWGSEPQAVGGHVSPALHPGSPSPVAHA